MEHSLNISAVMENSQGWRCFSCWACWLLSAVWRTWRALNMGLWGLTLSHSSSSLSTVLVPLSFLLSHYLFPSVSLSLTLFFNFLCLISLSPVAFCLPHCFSECRTHAGWHHHLERVPTPANGSRMEIMTHRRQEVGCREQEVRALGWSQENPHEVIPILPTTSSLTTRVPQSSPLDSTPPRPHFKQEYALVNEFCGSQWWRPSLYEMSHRKIYPIKSKQNLRKPQTELVREGPAMWQSSLNPFFHSE